MLPEVAMFQHLNVTRCVVFLFFFFFFACSQEYAPGEEAGVDILAKHTHKQYGDMQCFSSVVVYVGAHGHRVRLQDGILFVRETPERLHPLENVTRAVINIVEISIWGERFCLSMRQ